MALNDFRCGAQNSAGIGAISDIKAGLRRTEIRVFMTHLSVGGGPRFRSAAAYLAAPTGLGYPTSIEFLAREGQMTICLRRREFIATLGGAAASWPLAAGAQRGERLRRVGVLWPETEANIAFIQRSIRDELQKLNWIEGRNLLFDVRFGDGDPVRIRGYAAELVSLKPDVIVTVGSLATRAVQQETPTIPIVFVVASDPFSSGLVKSVARPEGNTTGIG